MRCSRWELVEVGEAAEAVVVLVLVCSYRQRFCVFLLLPRVSTSELHVNEVKLVMSIYRSFADVVSLIKCLSRLRKAPMTRTTFVNPRSQLLL